MDKTEIQGRMRELLTEYNELKTKLDLMQNEVKLVAFEKKQRAAFEEFKTKYTVEIVATGTRPIDWADVERNVFNEENLKTVPITGLGWSLGYDSMGDPGIGCNYGNGGTGCTYALDEADALRQVEREKRRQEYAATRKGR